MSIFRSVFTAGGGSGPALTGTLAVAAPAAPPSVAVAIAAGQNISAIFDLDAVPGRAHRLVFPAGFAWDAAQLTILASVDGAAFNTLHRLNDDGSAAPAGIVQSAQIVAGRSLVLPPEIFFAVRYLRFQSGTPAAPVNQAAARNFTLALAPR